MILIIDFSISSPLNLTQLLCRLGCVREFFSYLEFNMLIFHKTLHYLPGMNLCLMQASRNSFQIASRKLVTQTGSSGCQGIVLIPDSRKSVHTDSILRTPFLKIITYLQLREFPLILYFFIPNLYSSTIIKKEKFFLSSQWW